MCFALLLRDWQEKRIDKFKRMNQKLGENITMEDETKMKVGCSAAAIIVAIGLVWWGVASFDQRVDVGNTGILLQYGINGNPQLTTIPTGSYVWVNHFAGQTLITYPTAQQQLVLASRSDEGELTGDSTIPCLMSGGGTLNIGLTVNWQVDTAHPEILYLKKPGVPLTSSLNNDINTTVVLGTVKSDLLDLCTKYTWEDVLGDGTGPSKADNLKNDLLKDLQADLKPNGIIVNQVFLGERNPDATIKAVLSARNDAQKSAYLQQQAQYQAQAEIAKAQGDAQAIKIVNDQLQNSPAYNQYETIQKWDGKLPNTLVTDGKANPVLAATGQS
jgi:regulator of protease activity HflC (stomatin/prohibitin superfamily)